jgi:hypothetical protein
MTSLRDVEHLTKGIHERSSALHDNLTGDEVDFAKLVELADQVAATADKLAATFAEMDEALTRTLNGEWPTGNGPGEKGEEGLTEALAPGRAARKRRRSEQRADEEPTKDELLERAKEVDLSGRSEMSKQELRKSLDKEDALTKAELLERARQADIPGRSEMSKDELRRALNEAS